MTENDLISRAKLLDKIDQWANQVKGGIHPTDRIVWDVLEGVTDTIYDEEAVEAEPKWISVKERLPENEGWVLIIGLLLKKRSKWNYGWCVPHVAEYRHGRWCDSDGMFPDLEERSLKVTHWMPLPEPPKEEHHADAT